MFFEEGEKTIGIPWLHGVPWGGDRVLGAKRGRKAGMEGKIDRAMDVDMERATTILLILLLGFWFLP